MSCVCNFGFAKYGSQNQMNKVWGLGAKAQNLLGGKRVNVPFSGVSLPVLRRARLLLGGPILSSGFGPVAEFAVCHVPSHAGKQYSGSFLAEDTNGSQFFILFKPAHHLNGAIAQPPETLRGLRWVDRQPLAPFGNPKGHCVHKGSILFE